MSQHTIHIFLQIVQMSSIQRILYAFNHFSSHALMNRWTQAKESLDRLEATDELDQRGMVSCLLYLLNQVTSRQLRELQDTQRKRAQLEQYMRNQMMNILREQSMYMEIDLYSLQLLRLLSSCRH